MPIKIRVDLIADDTKHTVVLPQTQNVFDNTLCQLKLFDGGWNDYKVCRVSSRLSALDRSLAYGQDIEELNFLAQLLDGFSDKEIMTYESFLNYFQNISTTQYLINVAYSFLGINGGLYDDRFFPEYDFETDYFMKVKLSLPNQIMGVYVYLPANQSVIDRALLRLGVSSLEECIISKCTCGTLNTIKQFALHQQEMPQIINLVKKIVKIPRNKIENYIERVINEVYDGNLDNLIALTDSYLIAN
jgi:hypothetical protein